MSRFDPRFDQPTLPEYRVVTIYGNHCEIKIYPEGNGYAAEYEGKVIYANSPQAAFETILESIQIDLYTEN